MDDIRPRFVLLGLVGVAMIVQPRAGELNAGQLIALKQQGHADLAASRLPILYGLRDRLLARLMALLP